MKDITQKLKSINETDRVFEHDGKFVKVRIIKEQPPEGTPSFGAAFLRVSGSETDAAGRALPLGESYRIAPAQVRTIMSGKAVDLAALLDTIREECVLQTLEASAMQEQFDQLLT